MKRREKYSKETIERFQWDRLKNMLDHAYSNCPFYKAKFDKAGIKPGNIQTKEDLIKIPVTKKEELILAGEGIFAKGFNAGNCFSSRTSGSTGQPFTSYFDRDSWNIFKYASKLRARRACGLKFGAKIVNIEACSADEAREKNNKSGFLKDLAVNAKFLSVYDDIENHIDFYNRFRPDALYGFGSYFSGLADFSLEKGIKWNKPEMIFTSGEMLDDLTRGKLEDFFGKNVFDIYGCTELKEVAWQCPKKEGYHINDDLFLAEIVNPDNNGVGRIAVTSLANVAMPLIRYTLGDLGRLSDKPCSCGRPFSLMEPVLGRSVDMFTLEDGKKISPYALTMSVENIKGIMQYQIIQENKNNVTVKIRPDGKWLDKNKSEIEYQLKKRLSPGTDIQVLLVEKIDREANGKFKIVKSNLI